MNKKSKKIDDMDGIELAEILKEAETYEPSYPANGRQATQSQREEFANLLRFAIDIVGAPPRGYEDDEQSVMEREGSNYERRKRKAKRKLEDIIRALREMADRYPELEAKYKQDLDKLP